jgi:hypothetical protein
MIGYLLIAATALGLWKRHENPHWTPFSTVFATPRQLNEALERVRFTSVPTPTPTAGLDPGMSSDQVQSINVTLSSETDIGKIHQEAATAKALGLENTSKALKAKADAVAAAKAKGATDTDVHKEQLAATAAQPSAAVTHAAGFEWGRRDHRRDDRGGDQQQLSPWQLMQLYQNMQGGQMPMQHHHHHRHHEMDFGRDPFAQYATQGPHGGGGGGGHPMGGGGGGHPMGGGHEHFGHEGGGWGGDFWGYEGFAVDPYLPYFDPAMLYGGDEDLEAY